MQQRTVEIEESLYEVLKETDLLAFQTKLAIGKQLTRLDHFQDVTDDELMSYGLSTPAVRRLRNAIKKRQKLAAKKGKPLFGGKREKLVKITADNSAMDFLGNDSVFQSTSSENAPCLIDRSEIKLMEVLGEGTFAVVRRAIWNRGGSNGGRKLDCAVKILHDMSEQVRADLFAEVSHMQKLNHPNLVHLFGAVVGESTFMVLEYCHNGSLLNRLRSTDKDRLLVTRLLNYARQIANGMSYLEARRFVHRDLAARNVLLTDNEEVVKICDFGLTKSLDENQRLYVMSTPKKVPFAWCPPESLRFRQFSHKSDVWAFAVTLWELYTYGEEPWIGCKAIDVLNLTEAGEMLRIPDYCSEEIYAIMRMCWHLTPENRPKFSHLRTLLQDIKFMTAVCRTAQQSALDYRHLPLEVSEQVVLISERENGEWFGQSVRSRRFGLFDRSAVTVRSHRTSTTANTNGVVSSPSFADMLTIDSSQNMNGGLQETAGKAFSTPDREISVPLPGSFIHTGHGDTNESNCWGYVDKIDEIYLRNPILNGASAGQSRRSISLFHSVNSCSNNISQPKAMENCASGSNNNNRSLSASNLNNAWNEFCDVQASTSAEESISLKEDVRVKNGKGNYAWQSFFDASITTFDTATQEKSLTDYGSRFSGETTAAIRLPPPAKSSKYDSAISIPRPNRNSPVQKQDASASLRISQPAQQTSFSSKLENAKPSTSSLSAMDWTQIDSTFLRQRKGENDEKGVSNIGSADTSPNNGARGMEKDPFEVANDVRALATKVRYNEVLMEVPSRKLSDLSSAMTSNRQRWKQEPQISHRHTVSLEISQNLLHNIDERCGSSLRCENQVQSQTPPDRLSSAILLPSNTSISGVPIKNDKLKQHQPIAKQRVLLPPPSETTTANLAVAAPHSSQTPPVIAACTRSALSPESTVGMVPSSHNPVHYPPSVLPSAQILDSHRQTPTASFLPPPSQLLVSGLLQYNNGSSGSVLGEGGGGRATTANSIISAQYQPIFSIGGPSMCNREVPNGQPNNPRLRFGTNGIPILEPLTATSTPYSTIGSADSNGRSSMSSMKRPVNADTTSNKNQEQKQPIVVDLADLDVDALLAKVNSAASFASAEQCRRSLRRHAFDVDNAVRELKVEKLLEMGVVGDRHLAASALDASGWDVAAAVDRLIS